MQICQFVINTMYASLIGILEIVMCRGGNDMWPWDFKNYHGTSIYAVEVTHIRIT